MSQIYADRVKETTATTGTGTLTLAGAATQFQTFLAGVGNGNTCDYCILGGNGTDWEVGNGTYTSGGNTLSRDTVYASTNSGSKVSLTGTSTVYLTASAHRITNQTTLISSINLAGTNVAAWTGLVPGNYYMVGSQVITASNANSATFEFGTGGTPTWDATAGNYDLVGYFNHTSNTAFSGFGGTNQLLLVLAAMASTSAHGFDLTVVDNYVNSRWNRINSGTGEFESGVLNGRWKGTVANITAVRMILTTGNFTSGTISLYQMPR